MIDEVLRGYAVDASALIDRFESITPDQLYAPVMDLIPCSPAAIADIGAGTGRDAAWLANKGHKVIAVEPVAELREAGKLLHSSSAIEWLDDRLPELSKLRDRGRLHDCLLLSGVWQHLDGDQRGVALQTLGALALQDGLVVISLRHGPGAPERPVYEVDAEGTIDEARQAGLFLKRKRQADSLQEANRAAGVYWTWLAFGRR